MNEQIHIGIAEDHDLFRDGLVSLLRDQEDIKVVFDVSNGRELLAKLKTIKPHIILLDLEMPVMSGGEALEMIQKRYPKIKIIILSASYNESFVVEYVKKGVHSFLPKNCKLDRLIDAIYNVHKLGMYFDHRASVILARELSGNKEPEGDLSNEELTDKEKTIVRLICQNKTSEEIGSELSLSKKTIDYHRGKILKKTGAISVTTLITYAMQHKIISIQKPKD